MPRRTEIASDWIGDAAAAAIAGYDVDTFRRVWPLLVKDEAMPAPRHNFKRDGERSRKRSWDRVALERWNDGRRDERFRDRKGDAPLSADRAKLEARLSRLAHERSLQ